MSQKPITLRAFQFKRSYKMQLVNMNNAQQELVIMTLKIVKVLDNLKVILSNKLKETSMILID